MTDTIEIDGLTFRVTLEPDRDADAPWDNEDTFGAVTHWERRSKGPGERILNTNRSNEHRFYDQSGAVAKARREGYSGPDAVQAVEREFDRLRGWCNDDWRYVGVVVTLLDVDGEPTDECESLWGVDDDGDYKDVVAGELASGLHSRIGHTDVLVTERRIREAA